MSMDVTLSQQFGNYRLTSLIGQGGFARVYLGEHIYLKTQAAIKILQTRLSHEEQERFYAEARTIAHLQHEHIVRVLEFGLKDDSIPYLVMEYALNGTLRDRFPRGIPQPLEYILQPFKQVAAALHYAHGENLIHRDIKPENMLLGAQNEVLLSDFGIALMVRDSRHQDVQDVAGTVTYMAPEQLQGHPTRASDQYALGVVVYEWLTGTRLFHGSFTEVATQHILKPPPSLRECVPAIPVAVDQVVLKALAKDPEQRFASIQDFANALEAAAQGQLVSLNEFESEIPIDKNVASRDRSIPLATTEPALLHNSLPLLSSLAGKRTRTVSSTLKIALLALALLLIAGGGLAYALFRPQAARMQQDEQALYTRITSGAPQISDPLNAESSLSWLAGSTGTCQFKGGALHGVGSDIEVCETIYMYLRNFAYQAEVTVLQGENGGLTFRDELLLNPSRGYYRFIMTTQGNFGLTASTITYTNQHLSSLPDKQLISLQHSAAIKTGLGQTNLLSVIALGSDIYLYINKQFVGHIKDSTVAMGTIGMFSLGASGSDKVDAMFKNVQVWTL